MKVTEGILELLKRNGKITVPQFGVFYTEKTRALLNSDQKTILPPAQEVKFDADYNVQNDELLQFLNSEGNSFAANELRAQTDYWKNLLLKKDGFKIDGLGEFFVSDNQLVFRGNRIQSETPDFYGLEEINLSEIKNNSAESVEITVENEEGSYRLNKSILWVFLLVMPVLGLAYFGFTQQERILGKKSFDDLQVKNSTHRIEKKVPVKIDTVQQKAVADSLTKDSLAKVAAVPVQKSTKKWTSKNKWSSKKNTKKKWRPKKRQTH